MVFILLLSGFCSLGGERKAKKNKQEEKRPGKYEQLFKGKMCTTVSSDFMTLHKVDGKLYFEMPLEVLGREMLLASSVAKTSNNMAAVAGQYRAIVFGGFDRDGESRERADEAGDQTRVW